MHDWIDGETNLPFDVVALTAPNQRAASAFFPELCAAVADLLGEVQGACEKQGNRVLCVCIADPRGARVGSGGGTINALAEIGAAIKQEVDAGSGGSFSDDCRILLIHSGGDSQRSPTQCVCGKAWVALNSSGSKLSRKRQRPLWCTPTNILLETLCGLFEGGLPQGAIVIASCDVLLNVPQLTSPLRWHWAGGVVGLGMSTDESYAKAHGVYGIDFSTNVEAHNAGEESQEGAAVRAVGKYLQKPSIAEVEAKNAFLPSSRRVAIDTGVVAFMGKAATALRRMATAPSFQGCTAAGVMAGVTPLRLELYSDILFAVPTTESAVLCASSKEENILDSSSSQGSFFDAYLASCGPALETTDPVYLARKEIYELFNGAGNGGDDCSGAGGGRSQVKMGCLLLRSGANFAHLGTTGELMALMTLQMEVFNEPFDLHHIAGMAVVAESGPGSVIVADGATVVNSQLAGAGSIGKGAVVEHCTLAGLGWSVGEGSLASGVRRSHDDAHLLILESEMALQEVSLGDNFVVSMYGIHDGVKLHYQHPQARVCGVPWSELFALAHCDADCIWPAPCTDAQRTLWHAKLFPVLSCPGDSAQVMWLQRLRALSGPDGNAQKEPEAAVGVVTEIVQEWIAKERLSFSDILARADPQTEFRWRKELRLFGA